MTAAIVTHRSRTPIGDRAAASWAYSGGAERRHETGTAPGQLWERVAEASDETFRYVWRGEVPRGRAVCVAIPGAQLGRHVCPVHASNGIIRAGERIK